VDISCGSLVRKIRFAPASKAKIDPMRYLSQFKHRPPSAGGTRSGISLNLFAGASRLCFASILSIALVLGIDGCNWNRTDQDTRSAQDEQRQRDEKTRDDVAKATERLKPAIEDAGRKLDDAAAKAAEEARAAAQGVKEGWDRGAHASVDLNSATERELTELPGITGPEARRIIHGRPYRDKRDLVARGILSHSSYDKIQDQIAAK
jgi:DNA uptake protein ComE-like DNA-binding protein